MKWSASVLIVVAGSIAANAHTGSKAATAELEIGHHQVSTIPFDPKLIVDSATYTPSGKVLVSYARQGDAPHELNLAIMNDDGSNVRTIFSGKIPAREKDNGLRFMVFSDNKRVFLGDFVLECARSLDTCTNPTIVPVDYPAEVASGDHISHRWSEMIVAPDNRHIAWTTLLANYSAIVFTGELKKSGGAYKVVHPQIVSTVDPFQPDPRHPDGVLPKPVLGGEVKQFVHGGTAISLVGAVRRDVPNSVVQSLVTGKKEEITDLPGYTETTIFSPDERLGITMTTRFSERTDPAILGLVPRPYPDSLNMDLSMVAYTYAVTGVRRGRSGNVGPALIDIEASKTREGYQGINLNTEEEWVYYSPMSWHPGGRKAMWLEGRREGGSRRMQVVTLPDYRPSAPVAARPTPDRISYGSSDLSAVKRYAQTSQNIDVKVYGRHSGYITYRRTPQGVTEKTYFDFSDDGKSFYSGSEKMVANPRGQSTYTAKLSLKGPRPGTMDLQMTFGPLGGDLPARLIFAPDGKGVPLTHGYAEYDGRRIDVDKMAP